MIRGTGVSPGIAIGTARVLACAERSARARRSIEPGEVGGELARFATALGRAAQELLTLKASVTERIGASEGQIFAAQGLVLESPSFRDQVSNLVRDRRINVEAALAEVIETFTRSFDGFADPYLRERAA